MAYIKDKREYAGGINGTSWKSSLAVLTGGADKIRSACFQKEKIKGQYKYSRKVI